MAPDEETGVRLAELVAALSLPVDLGLGQPMEHVLRSTTLALRLAEAEDLDVDDRAAAYYVSLLAWVVCVADTHEVGIWFGDEADLAADAFGVDLADTRMLLLTAGFALLLGGVLVFMSGRRPHARRARARR